MAASNFTVQPTNRVKPLIDDQAHSALLVPTFPDYPLPASSFLYLFMVIIDDKKYSCKACIRGHRASSCKHTDRELVPVRPKGRPVTQCPKCRDLRKTKHSHVKCQCTYDNTLTTENKGRHLLTLFTLFFYNWLHEILLLITLGLKSDSPSPKRSKAFSSKCSGCSIVSKCGVSIFNSKLTMAFNY